MTIDAAATFVDSILGPDGDCDYLQTYLNTDWESAKTVEHEFASLTPELLDLSKHCTSNSLCNNTDTAISDLPAAPSTAQRSPADQLDKRQLKLKQSREAQKRSRERQKARAYVLQSQLVHTTAELESLRNELEESQARALLLEKVASLNKQQGAGPDCELGVFETFWNKLKTARAPELHTDAGAAVPITIFGNVHMMPISEVSKLTLAQYSRVCLEYIRRMGSLLLQSDGQAHSDPAAVNELQQVSVEYGEFACALINFNLDAATALYTGKLGDDKNAPTSLSEEQYHVLVGVIQLCPDQVKDMLLLRHIHIARREQLATERQQLLDEMAASHGEAWDTRQNVSKMATLTTALTENAAQDYQVDAEVQCAALRGVIDIKQFALMMVHGFPYMPSTRKLLNAVEAVHADFARQHAPAIAASGTTMSNMRKLDCYLKSFKPDAQLGYIPFMQHDAKPNVSMY